MFGRWRPGPTTSRGGLAHGFRGTLAAYLEATLLPLLERSPGSDPPPEALWYSGAYLLETVPWVLYILARWGHDPEEAGVRAVNDTKDNDTVAAIVGSAVGALHGADAFPERWVRGLTGRLEATDDGTVFVLLDRVEAWLEGRASGGGR